MHSIRILRLQRKAWASNKAFGSCGPVVFCLAKYLPRTCDSLLCCMGLGVTSACGLGVWGPGGHVGVVYSRRIWADTKSLNHVLKSPTDIRRLLSRAGAGHGACCGSLSRRTSETIRKSNDMSMLNTCGQLPLSETYYQVHW